MQDFLQTHKWPFQMFWLCLMWDLQQTLSSVITPRNWILFTLCSQPLKTKGTSQTHLCIWNYTCSSCVDVLWMLFHLLTLEERVTLGGVLLYSFLYARYASVFAGHDTPECTQFTAAPAGGAEQQPSRWPWRHPGLRCCALESLRSFSVLLEENTKIACRELWPCLSLVDDDFPEHLKR